MKLAAPVVLITVAIGCQGVISEPPGSEVRSSEACGRTDNPPRLRRLSHLEYDRTVSDLLFVDVQASRFFPAEERSSDGFDNAVGLLAVTPGHADRYLSSAIELAEGSLGEGSNLRARHLDCSVEDAECERRFITELGLRAYRRPLASDEIEQLRGVAETARAAGADYRGGLEASVAAMLVSPAFLYRVEGASTDPTGRPMGDYELASRLSYFLWRSMPDDELLSVAGDGALDSETTLREQVDRMLDDERSDAFFESFADGWLSLRELEYVSSSQGGIELDDELKASMRAETVSLLRHFTAADLPIPELLTSTTTFVDERLAAHYGTEAPSTRGGLLTHAAVLTVTSHEGQTSPVKRGKWVLDNLLCSPPPPPPADVNDELPDPGEGATLRDVLAQHRADPACASCHSLMDPIGLALEEFDSVGRFRSEIDGLPVDASGELPTGEQFDGARELGEVLASDPRFSRCVSRKLVALAIGQSGAAVDSCTLDGLLDRAPELGFRQLLVELVLSDSFRVIGGEEGGL